MSQHEDECPKAVLKAMAGALKELDRTLLWVGYAVYGVGFTLLAMCVGYIVYLKLPGVLVDMWNNIGVVAVCVAMMAAQLYFYRGK